MKNVKCPKCMASNALEVKMDLNKTSGLSITPVKPCSNCGIKLSGNEYIQLIMDKVMQSDKTM